MGAGEVLIPVSVSCRLHQTMQIGGKTPLGWARRVGGRLRGHDQATSEDSSGEIANPPPEGLNLDISCPVESLVVAEGFSSTKLPNLGSVGKDSISPRHHGDGCEKP